MGFSLRHNVICKTNFIHQCMKYKIDNHKRAQMDIKEYVGDLKRNAHVGNTA
jgi:hypothetical protein